MQRVVRVLQTKNTAKLYRTHQLRDVTLEVDGHVCDAADAEVRRSYGKIHRYPRGATTGRALRVRDVRTAQRVRRAKVRELADVELAVAVLVRHPVLVLRRTAAVRRVADRAHGAVTAAELQERPVNSIRVVEIARVVAFGTAVRWK